jgi:hypothetical protein
MGHQTARRGVSTPDLTRWVTPVSSALQHFELYWTPLTDAPREYLIPAGLSTIGTVIANRVYIPFGGDRIDGNTWNVLLGPSSTYRKSTVVKFARRTLSRLTEGQPQHYVFPDEFSKEALVGRLAEQAQGLLTYREFSGALAGFSRDYMSGTKELLADLYDCPETYERIVGARPSPRRTSAYPSWPRVRPTGCSRRSTRTISAVGFSPGSPSGPRSTSGGFSRFLLSLIPRSEMNSYDT